MSRLKTSRLTSLFAATALGATGVIAAAPAAHAQPRLPQEPTLETVADPACSALATAGLFKDMTVTSAQAVKLGAGPYT